MKFNRSFLRWAGCNRGVFLSDTDNDFSVYKLRDLYDLAWVFGPGIESV